MLLEHMFNSHDFYFFTTSNGNAKALQNVSTQSLSCFRHCVLKVAMEIPLHGSLSLYLVCGLS